MYLRKENRETEGEEKIKGESAKEEGSEKIISELKEGRNKHRKNNREIRKKREVYEGVL
jgi:hypothetical protein